jgi:hypothetical protein
MVDNRCPEDLDGKSDTDPGEKADRGAGDLGIAQPQRQRGEQQQERQASGEAEE